MSNIQPWYDYTEKRYRDDVYPFQVTNRFDRKTTAKLRLSKAVASMVTCLPKGWSVNWKVSRKRVFRVNHSNKTISLPMPAEYAGLAILTSAVHLARLIDTAIDNSVRLGQLPAVAVKAWPFLYGSHFSRYYYTYLPGRSGWVSRQSKAAYQAGLQSAKEVLRFYQSPAAWRIPRRKAGSPQIFSLPHFSPKEVDGQLLSAIAHRKVLMDYLKVNDPAYSLPAIAKAKLKKIHQPTTTP
jgi:hypothetical protein